MAYDEEVFAYVTIPFDTHDVVLQVYSGDECKPPVYAVYWDVALDVMRDDLSCVTEAYVMGASIDDAVSEAVAHFYHKKITLSERLPHVTPEFEINITLTVKADDYGRAERFAMNRYWLNQETTEDVHFVQFGTQVIEGTVMIEEITKIK